MVSVTGLVTGPSLVPRLVLVLVLGGLVTRPGSVLGLVLGTVGRVSGITSES